MKSILDIQGIELARLLGVTPAYVSHIKKGRKKLPVKHAQLIHKHYNIPLWELRPDIYPKELFESAPNKDDSSLESGNQ